MAMISRSRSIFLFSFEVILCHILEIEFIEMRKAAISAADSKMPASYDNIMRASYMTVPAICGFFKVPDIITPDFSKCTRLRYILNAGDKDPCCTTIVARYFGLVGYGFNNLISNLSAVIAVSAIPGKNKLVAHGKYWMFLSSLICCRLPPAPLLRHLSILFHDHILHRSRIFPPIGAEHMPKS